MKRTRAWATSSGLSFTLLFCAVVYGQPSSGADSNIIQLASGTKLLGIDQKTGRIALLSAGKHTLLASPRGRGPFRVHLPLSDFEAHMVEAHQTQPAVEATADTVRLGYAHLVGKRGPLDIEAKVTIRSTQDGGFELSCRIHNGTQIKIPQVFFPWISGFSKIDGADDQVTFGHSTFKPWEAWRAPPEHLFMQYRGHPTFEMLAGDGYKAGIKWMDWSGQTAGASLFAKQREPVTQYMLVSSDGYGRETLDLAWYFYPFIEPGADWQSPTFVLYPHSGDWHNGILKFKEFSDVAFTPVPSTPARDETLGQQCLWLGWAFQDWQDTPMKFKDIPSIAAEARRAGFREISLWGTFEYFRLPHTILSPLGSDADFKKAVEDCRAVGVNAVPIISCRLINPAILPAAADKPEWFVENVAGQTLADNWSYHPDMIPRLPIRQLGSYAAYYACEGSRQWRAAYFNFLKKMVDTWGLRGVMFDQATVTIHNTSGLCFNPRHPHAPDGQWQCLTDALIGTKKYLRDQFGNEAVLAGESLWDLATEWTDYTSDWAMIGDEPLAPFHMAFPRARQSIKCLGQRMMLNRVFTGGYWIELYLEEGAGRLRDYPDLSAYLQSLAEFKKHFSRFFNKRDAYLHNLFAQATPTDGAWVRVHRSGDEALVLVTHRDGRAENLELTLDARAILGDGPHRAVIYSRTLEQRGSRSDNSGKITANIAIPAEDFVALHLTRGQSR
jgi:hypothetical protein